MGTIFRNIIIVIIWLVLAISSGGVKYACADEADIFTANVKSNALIILDNSNSMDEDFVGNAICSWATGSRAVESRRNLINLVNANANNMRIGLLSFRVAASSKWHLHNGPYFVSYSRQSWCPNPPPECVDYCQNYPGHVASKNTCNAACQADNPFFDADYSMNDANGKDFLAAFAANSEPRNRYCNLTYPKTTRIVNPTDGGHHVYWKIPGTFYDSANDGNGFCYGTAYTANDTAAGDSYSCYHTKTSNNDDYPANYAGNFYNGGFGPTDEDIALGFKEFGKRQFWYHTGQTWFANSSPGDGYLHVACADNLGNNAQLNALTAKLAMHENDEAGYMSCGNTGNPNACSYIVDAGLTPTAGTFRSAINYFKGENDYQSGIANTSPILGWCQKNFIIYVTDGLPSTNDGGGNDTAVNLMPAVLAQIDALRALQTPAVPGYTFDIPTYVLGMALTDQSKVQLDAMAVHGGTDVGGHAYYADDPTALATALAAIQADIISRTYSFSVASVSSSRITDENYLYEASFTPVNADPFWRGYLKKYNLNADGTLGSVVWEAGANLAARDFSTRNLYTSSNGSLITFDTSISRTRFNVGTNAQRDNIVGYVQGDPSYNPDGWKLGDIFHSTPINVGTPNVFFEDVRDQNYVYTCNSATVNAFNKFRCDNPRTSANGLRLIVTGANDGQFHAFKTVDGSEKWSFVPPNLLPQLQNLAHTTNPSALVHPYLVDGPVTVADAWWKSAGGTDDGTSKVNSDWHTLAIFGEGKGGANLWSSDGQCDSGYQDTADATYNHYCGYYAFDLTDAASIPASYKWHLGGTGAISASDRPYLGAPWSKMMVGRVRYTQGGAVYEKWVGFIGGGYNGTDCSGGGACGVCDCRGKGFYVVDLSNGHILWSYTYGNDANMKYSMPASPAIVDTDQDGFVDTAYVGDLKGNMWRFKFCRGVDMPDCGISGQTVNWTGGRLYNSATVQPIFQTASVAVDNQQNLWIYWGTGNKEVPKDTGSGGTIFGMKDDDRSTTYTIGNLKDISTAGQTYNTGDAQDGYYINLGGTGEKMLADPTVFGGVVYFTTYTPPNGGDICMQGGTASLYALNYTSGDGAFGGSRSMSLGAGIASSPMISMKPGGSTIGDIYVTLSGGSGQSASTQRVNYNPPGLSNRVNIINWKDRRIQ
ncbi:MAG: pilus assembly protein [Syntrophales bacterium]